MLRKLSMEECKGHILPVTRKFAAQIIYGKGENGMGNVGGVAAILAVCLIVLGIGAMGRKVEWLVNFILRAVMGTIGIYAINYMLAMRQIQVAVGINPFTILTSGVLGFPGVAVLYGIHFFKIL